MRRKSRKSNPENGAASSETEENQENGSENPESDVIAPDNGEAQDVKKSKTSSKSEEGSKRSAKKKKAEAKEAADDDDDEEQENGAENEDEASDNEGKDGKRRKSDRKGSSKGAKKPAKTPRKSKKGDDDGDEEDGPEESYEVEAIVDSKTIRGVKHYLIRWKGYDASSDTWESKDSLNCPERIKEFNDNNKKSPKKREIKKTPNKDAKRRKVQEEEEDEGDDDDADYEVDKIVEVHHKKNGKKEFLVSWKGYPHSQDSWVDEEDMDCKDLIAKFMAKVERAKSSTPKQLRENRSQTERFTLTTRESGRRLSRRNKGKQRVQYHNTE